MTGIEVLGIDSHFSSCLNASSDRNKSWVPEAVDSERLPSTDAGSDDDERVGLSIRFLSDDDMSFCCCCYDV